MATKKNEPTDANGDLNQEASHEQGQELDATEVLDEQGNVLPDRALMRHHRHHNVVNFGAIANASDGSAANANSNVQIGGNNTNTTNQTANVLNIDI